MLILVSIISLSCVIACPQIISAQESGESFLTYVNSTYGITINYPSDWDKAATGIPIEGVRLGKLNMSVVVTFFPPDRLVSIGVMTAKLPSNETQNLSDFNNTAISRVFRSMMPGVKVEGDNTTLAGSAAKNITLMGTIPISEFKEKFRNTLPPEMIDTLELIGVKELTIKGMIIFTIIGDRIYGINYASTMPTGSEDPFSLYLHTVQKMIKSFKVIDAERNFQ